MSRGVECSDLFWSELRIRGRQMDPVGVTGDGHVSAGVDEETSAWCGLGMQDGEHGAGSLGQVTRRKVFFAELEVIDAGSGTLSGLNQQRVSTGRFRVGETDAVRDGVTKHGSSVGAVT